MQIVLIEMADLHKAVKSAMIEFREEQQEQAKGEKLHTINQVSKRLGKAHQTIKKLVEKGLIKSTKDGLISEASISEYLQNS